MSKTIPLSRGKVAIVDDEDYEWLILRRKWSLRDVTGKNFHAGGGRNGNGYHEFEYMHRVIMGAKKGEVIDHINGNGLDNRKCNLRIVTTRENNQNRPTTERHKKMRTEKIDALISELDELSPGYWVSWQTDDDYCI